MKNMCTKNGHSSDETDSDPDSSDSCYAQISPLKLNQSVHNSMQNSHLAAGGKLDNWKCRDCQALHPANYLGCPISFQRRALAEDLDLCSVQPLSSTACRKMSNIAVSPGVADHKTSRLSSSSAFASSCADNTSPRWQVQAHVQYPSPSQSTENVPLSPSPVTMFSARPKPFFPHLDQSVQSLPTTHCSIRSPSQLPVLHWSSMSTSHAQFGFRDKKPSPRSGSSAAKSRDMGAHNASESSTDSHTSNDIGAVSHFRAHSIQSHCRSKNDHRNVQQVQACGGEDVKHRLKNLSADHALTSDSDSSNDSLDHGYQIHAQTHIFVPASSESECMPVYVCVCMYVYIGACVCVCVCVCMCVRV